MITIIDLHRFVGDQDNFRGAVGLSVGVYHVCLGADIISAKQRILQMALLHHEQFRGWHFSILCVSVCL